MAIRVLRPVGLAVIVTAVTLAGCTSYIKRDEYDTAIADLRASDQRMQSQIDALTQQIDGLSQKYDALVTQVAGRIRVESGAHFATGDATLSDQDKPLLDDFAKAVSSSHSDAVVTVEGFADPAGGTRFNQRLGMRRAKAVRDYLVTTGGLPDGQVRAVSYGEANNRQVRPGATGDAGRDNRRVSLVIDYAGGGQQQSMPAEPTEPPPPPEPTQSTEPPPTPET